MGIVVEQASQTTILSKSYAEGAIYLPGPQYCSPDIPILGFFGPFFVLIMDPSPPCCLPSPVILGLVPA